MDEGCIEFLFIAAFWLAAIAVVGGLAVAAAVSIAGLGLAVGFGEALARFIYRFTGAYWAEAVRPPIAHQTDEPAALGYFFGPSFASVGSAAEHGRFGAQLASLRFSADPDALTGVGKYVTIAWNMGGTLGVITGEILGRIVFQLPAMIACLVLGAAAWVVCGVSWVGQRLFVLVRRVGYSCANEGCYARGRVPVYTCPRCGAGHASLWPNKYGVLYHTCKCGQSLPTLGVLGRRNLAATCRTCAGPLQGGETSDVHLVVVGPIGSGRSVATLGFVDALTAAAGNGPELVPADADSLSGYRASVLAGAEFGGAPRVTVLTHPGEGLDTGESVYVYDSPTDFSEAEAADQAFYDHIDAIAFMISAPQLLRGSGVQESPPSSRLELDELYSRVLKTFDAHSGQSAAAIRRARMAIVLTGVNPQVESAIAAASPDAELNEGIREWLFSASQGNFVRLMESDFRQVRYFTIHARVESPSSGAAEYSRVVDWLLETRRGARKGLTG